MYVYLKIKEQLKSLIMCYFIIETKQTEQNRTVHVAVSVFLTIQSESHTCFAFQRYSNKQRF